MNIPKHNKTINRCFRKKALAAACATLAGLSYNTTVFSAPDLQPQLLLNGSFENYTTVSNRGSWKIVQLPHWKAVNTAGIPEGTSGASIDINALNKTTNSEIWTSRIGNPATEGKHKIELDYSGAVDGLIQSFKTRKDNNHTLSFDAYARTPGSSDIEVWIDGIYVKTVTPANDWQSFSFDFKGTGTKQSILLRERASQNSAYGAIIDNVTVNEIAPLPTTANIVTAGQVQTGNEWAQLAVSQSIKDPVIILGTPTANETSPGVARLRRGTNSEYELRFEEWSYLDENHPQETIDWMAMVPGHHVLDDGTVIEAGRLDIEGKRWKKHKFSENFSSRPAVFVTLQTDNDSQPVTIRLRNINSKGFKATLQHEESLRKKLHGAEVLGYIAIQSPKAGSGQLNKTPYQLLTKKIRHKKVNLLGEQFWVQEEQSRDKETRHTKEKVTVLQLGNHYFAQGQTTKGRDTATIRRQGSTTGITLTGLKITAIGQNNIDIAWNPASGNGANTVTAYQVLVNGASSQTTGTSHSISGLIADTAYNIQIQAVDKAGNILARSNEIKARTKITPIVAPNAPRNLATGIITAESISLIWQTPQSGGINTYNIYRDGVLLTKTSDTSYTDKLLKAATKYQYSVSSVNSSGESNKVTISATTSAVSDTQAPTTPTGLVSSRITSNSAQLNWTAATDNKAVTGYKVLRDGKAIADITGITYTDKGLQEGKAYNYTVIAYDAAGNQSIASKAINVTTTSDTEAPTAPTGLVSSKITSNSVQLNWTAATDNKAVTGYKVLRDGAEVTDITGTTYTDTGLLGSKAYNYTVIAYDAASNQSIASNTLKVTTVDKTAPSIPANLQVTASKDAANLSWQVSTDNIGVTGYRIRRDGQELNTTSNINYVDTTVTAGLDYKYSVSAYDAAGNESAISAEVLIKITTPISPPSIANGKTLWLANGCGNCHSTPEIFYDKVDKKHNGQKSFLEALTESIKNNLGGMKIFKNLSEQDNADISAYVENQASGGSQLPPSDIVGVTLMSNTQTLRKAAVLLAGRLPTEAETTLAKDEAGLREAVRGLMQGENFNNFIYSTASEWFLTAGAQPDAERKYFIGTFANLASIRGSTDDKYREDVRREPLELTRFIVENDRSWEEIVTADYSIVSEETLTDVYEGQAVNLGGVVKDGWTPGRYGYASRGYTGSKRSERVYNAVNHQDKPYPHAGVLSTMSWLDRFPTTATNRNRHRAYILYKQFLGVDIEALGERPNAGSDLGNFKIQLMENPNCTVCHTFMDPAAAAFMDFGELLSFRPNGYEALDSTYKSDKYPKHPYSGEKWYKNGDRWYREVFAPGFEGKDMPGGYFGFNESDPATGVMPAAANQNGTDSAMAWMTTELVQDPRFAKGAVRFWFRGLFGREALWVPQDNTDPAYAANFAAFQIEDIVFEQLADSFRNNGHIVRDLLADLVMSDLFRAGAVKPTITDTQRSVIATLGMNRLLRVDELNQKSEALIGKSLFGTGRNEITMTKTYSGFDGGHLLSERNSQITPTMLSALEQRLNNALCGGNVVINDFNLAKTERKLFPYVDLSDFPDNVITNFIKHEIFPGDSKIDQFRNKVDNSPSLLSKLDSSLNKDRYGERLSSLLAPKVTGDYRFRIAGDDDVELWLSTDDDPSNKQKIAFHNGYTAINQWDKNPSQTSDTIQLEAGRTYFIEVLHAEGSGLDFVSAGWQGPGFDWEIIGDSASAIFANQNGNQTPEYSNDSIRKNIQHLHSYLLGETLALAHPEIERTFALFKEVQSMTFNDTGLGRTEGPAYSCEGSAYLNGTSYRIDRNRTVADPHGSHRAWNAVLSYLLGDVRMINE